jgi:hypothetical protein
MRDMSMPPAFRVDCARYAAPYVHAKCPEHPTEQTVQIHGIRRIIVDPAQDRETAAELASRLNGGEPTEVVKRIETTTAADPVAGARNRLDRLRGIH